METAMPRCRWGSKAGYCSASILKSSRMFFASTETESAPPTIGRSAPQRWTSATGLVLAGADRLEHAGRRHRDMRQADTDGVRHGVGHGRQRRHDGGFANAAHAIGVVGV